MLIQVQHDNTRLLAYCNRYAVVEITNLKTQNPNNYKISNPNFQTPRLRAQGVLFIEYLVFIGIYLKFDFCFWNFPLWRLLRNRRTIPRRSRDDNDPLTRSPAHFLYGRCSRLKYSSFSSFTLPARRIMAIRLGMAMSPRAISPNPQTISSEKIPPRKIMNT